MSRHAGPECVMRGRARSADAIGYANREGIADQRAKAGTDHIVGPDGMTMIARALRGT
jgi:hypothetical protein